MPIPNRSALDFVDFLNFITDPDAVKTLEATIVAHNEAHDRAKDTEKRAYDLDQEASCKLTNAAHLENLNSKKEAELAEREQRLLQEEARVARNHEQYTKQNEELKHAKNALTVRLEKEDKRQEARNVIWEEWQAKRLVEEKELDELRKVLAAKEARIRNAFAE